MLSIGRRVQDGGHRPLTVAEDHALRQAFGRYGKGSARPAGAAVVQRYQHVAGGHWFYCDCRGDAARPPALIPVLERFVRRHEQAGWPGHDPDCDFARDQTEQRELLRSYAGGPAPGPLRLVRSLAETRDPGLPVGARRDRSISTRRDGLARLLTHLMVEAGLQRVAADGSFPPVAQQYHSLRQVAGEVELDQSLPLSRFLCTYAPALPELVAKIEAAPSCMFQRSRPHGILLTVVAGIHQGCLLPAQGPPIPVRGRISVWAEIDGHQRDTDADSVRAPYLAACLVAKATSATPPEALRAYVHPCVAANRLMLVDSNFERQTLAILLSVQAWLGRKQGIRFGIDRPLHDIGDGSTDKDRDEPREPCIPDWVLRMENASAAGQGIVIVETMGYADAGYWGRKQRMQALMSRVLKGAPVLRHEHHPSDRDQRWRDAQFWRELRWTITGSTHRAVQSQVPARPADRVDRSQQAPDGQAV